jgi:hypothetical protein
LVTFFYKNRTEPKIITPSHWRLTWSLILEPVELIEIHTN